MAKICFVNKKFNSEHRSIIDRANSIISEYQKQGYTLTLRQLYYQFVSRDWLANKQENYKKLGGIISDARRAGLIDWSAVEDRTRNLVRHSTWSNPAEIVAACAAQFSIDLWETQRNRIEVWVEKDALLGVLQVACDPLQLPYFSCRGYTSDSEIFSAARRLASYAESGKQPVVIHLGDHDPSGIDMSRDIFDRIELFSEGAGVEVKRIALNMEQIEQYKPPPNPAKKTDCRYRKYSETHGDKSWELDALSPSTIADLIQETVEQYIDFDDWDQSHERTEEGKRKLRDVSRRWVEITS